MLNVRTVKNALITDAEKDGYCFRSTCSQTLSEKDVSKEIASYNSSFAEADAMGMLNILNEIVVRYLARGYSVELPFGNLRVNASGTCSSIEDSFSQGTLNHQISFSFNANSRTVANVKENLEYKQLLPGDSREAKLYRMGTILEDASESDSLTVSMGKVVRLHGRNLSFDIDDKTQGVFVENESGVTRLSNYIRRGTNIIDVMVPADLAAGDYSVTLITKPGSSYFTAALNDELKVTA